MNDEVRYAINSLRALALIARADLVVCLGALEEVARTLGVDQIEGLSISDWHAKHRVHALDYELRAVEDLDPALAALLQAHIDDVKIKGGLSDPE